MRPPGWRAAVAATALAAAGVLPGTAGAKELSAVTACGHDGCRTARDPAAAAAVADDAMLTGPPPAAAPWFAIRLHVTHDGDEAGSWSVRWLPAAGVIRMTGETGRPRWYEPSFPGLLALERLTAGLRPVAPGGAAAEPRAPAAPGATARAVAARAVAALLVVAARAVWRA